MEDMLSLRGSEQCGEDKPAGGGVAATGAGQSPLILNIAQFRGVAIVNQLGISNTTPTLLWRNLFYGRREEQGIAIEALEDEEQVRLSIRAFRGSVGQLHGSGGYNWARIVMGARAAYTQGKDGAHWIVPPIGGVEMSTPVPEVIHTYQNHLLDSTRWSQFVPRDDDIVISTSLKSGTTWVQAIVAYLVLGTESIPDINQVSPWLDLHGGDRTAVLDQLDKQRHRRFIKSHLPLDGLPFYERARYIVVARDARDVFMSLWNHHTSYSPAFVADVNSRPGRVGPPLPGPEQEIHDFWRNWITRGWFAWESEGFPYWGNLHHTKTWWLYRMRENILFVHFNDLLQDLPGAIRRIARFLEIPYADQTIADVVKRVTFATIKENAGRLLTAADHVWTGGGQTFFFKGTNGRWKEVLSAEEVALYTEATTKLLPPACARWLEHGGALPDEP